MWPFSKKNNSGDKGTEKSPEQIKKDFQQEVSKSEDYKKTCYENRFSKTNFYFHFISALVDENILQKDVLPYLLENHFESIDQIKSLVPVADIEISDDPSIIEKKLFNGYVLVKHQSDNNRYAFVAAQKEVVRSITQPEVEFSVIGPKEAFVESIDQNINLIRKRLSIKELVIERFVVGTLSKTQVALIYVDGLTNEENVNTARQRIQDVDFDQINDSSYLEQIIADNTYSVFPQLLDTERPDRTAAVLAEGKLVIIVDGSPLALIGPTTLVEFFNAFEDYFLNWYISSFLRLLRVFAVSFSILITPVYVAALTYHYELIPKDLMATLITSRQEIPLPPILEAFFLELTIELLREAGARLPTKVGQTIGIVGGIVIGTASVEAGLTSNVLLIIVALAALASFTTPVYKMGNTIRVLRFPFLIFAQLWGLLGIVFCFSLLMAHLLQLSSLGRPFLEPLFPPRIRDFKDALIRLPFTAQSTRPEYLRTQKPERFNKKQATKKVDIDE
ncbi:spore germination protein [Falsibacillus pallidus]|uniref:GerA spore germination protein n=1 Tax=Falsibacillus pallidus TaxID=493781 RepID=A0A370GDU9_9BACI|nr:spore germination protein [Falsibacillus pallidus]RDI41410.1 GerA spore germination protein [Falsibacillus pallidus]